jgi:dTDP-4-dehydrorhamnose reductase
VNERGTAILLELSQKRNCRFVFVSTDLVFDGRRGGYREEDSPAPVTVYGETKPAAESLVLSYRNAAAVRMSLLYGPHLAGRSSFFDEQTTALRHGRRLTLYYDEWRSPLDLVTAAKGLVAVAESD